METDILPLLGTFEPAQLPAYLSVIGTCMVKYLIGVILAYAHGFNFWEILLSILTGGMIGVVFFSYFGSVIRKFLLRKFPPKKRSLRSALKWGRFWRKYGIVGVSAIAPFISPMLSVFIALAFREKPERVIRFVGGSILIWSFIFAFFQHQIQIWLK